MSIYLSLPQSVSACPYVFLFLVVYVSVWMSVCRNVCPRVSFSVFLYASTCLRLSQFVFVCHRLSKLVSVGLSVSQSLTVLISISLSLSQFALLCLSLYRYISVRVVWVSGLRCWFEACSGGPKMKWMRGKVVAVDCICYMIAHVFCVDSRLCFCVCEVACEFPS